MPRELGGACILGDPYGAVVWSTALAQRIGSLHFCMVFVDQLFCENNYVHIGIRLKYFTDLLNSANEQTG